MDILEPIIGRFWRREKPVQSISKRLEGRFSQGAWTYAHFREYLIALGRDRNFLLPQDQYPDLIELSQEWHEALEELRRETAHHGKEHYSVIGFTEIVRRISLQQPPAEGTSGLVPEEVVAASYSSASRTGIDKVLGDIHSHPHQSHLYFSLFSLLFR